MASDLESLSTKLREAAQHRTFGPKTRESKTAKIRALKRDIVGLRAKGATWEQVAEVLAEAGLQVSADTVRLAIGDGGKGERRTGTTRARRPATTGATSEQKKGAVGEGQTGEKSSGSPRTTGSSAVRMADEL